MLSYQHAYHAGHAADVVKHASLALLLAQLVQKPAPLTYLESHAGRGLYPLDGAEMQKTREYETGLNRIQPHLAGAPSVAQPYRDVLQRFAPDYPGSPMVAQALLRSGDVLHLCERHPGEVKHLRQSVKGDARIKVHAEDGHTALLPLLPPNSGRTVVLIDPSYEQKFEYGLAARTVATLLKHAPKAVILVWYPLLPTARHEELVEKVSDLAHPATWRAELTWREAGQGMHGTGMLALNLPWQMDEPLDALLDWLAPILEEDRHHANLRSGYMHMPR